MTINLHQIKCYLKHYFTARRKGHGVHSPFAYRLCEDVFYNDHPFNIFVELQSVRKNLQGDNTLLSIEDHGAGSKALGPDKRRVREIAFHGISPARQSELLFRLCNFLGCETCIELGTSIGLNALYLSAVNKNMRVVSIEGSEQLAVFATQLAAKNGRSNLEVVHGLFDEVLPGIISKSKTPFLLYIDGNHTYEATLRYFEMGITAADSNSVVVFDDIYWSKGMTAAWNEIKKHPRVKMTLDLFYLGIVFFKEEIKEPVHLKLLV